MRDASIEAVMEKEQEICELKFQIEELENFNKEQTEYFQNTIQVLESKLSRINSEKTSNSELLIDKLKNLEVL